MSTTASERSFCRGKKCLAAGDALAALAYFEAALRLAGQEGKTAPPSYLSYYGLSLAYATGQIPEAVRACRRALKAEFYNTELYLNLGKIYMLEGNRSAAFRTFLSGLKVESDDPGIQREVERMGMRRRPPFPFLSRSNPVNRVLGLLTPRQ